MPVLTTHNHWTQSETSHKNKLLKSTAEIPIFNSNCLAVERMNGNVPAKKELSTFLKEDSLKLYCLLLPTIPFLYNKFPPTLLKSWIDASRMTKKPPETLTRELPSPSQVVLNLTLGMFLKLAYQMKRTSMRLAVLITISPNTVKTLLLTVSATHWALPTEVELIPTATAIARKREGTKPTELMTQTEISKERCPDRLREPLLISSPTLSTDASPAAWRTASTGMNDHYIDL